MIDRRRGRQLRASKIDGAPMAPPGRAFPDLLEEQSNPRAKSSLTRPFSYNPWNFRRLFVYQPQNDALHVQIVPAKT
jgi:hypothetical protein